MVEEAIIPGCFTCDWVIFSRGFVVFSSSAFKVTD